MDPLAEHPATAALRQFADPANWLDQAGRLQWCGSWQPIRYVEDVLATLTTMCITCKARPPYGEARCPRLLCPFGLDAISMFLRNTKDAVP